MHDLIIIGGGPAGVSAGVYAARKQLKTLLITEEIGGQSTVSEGIENWIGTIKIPGLELAKALKAHLEAYKGDLVEVVEGERVTALAKSEGGFEVTTKSGARRARAVLIASGAARRKLAIPGAEKFENKGVTYCASCDGPLFAGADVAVVGGGNAGFETTAQLLAYAKSVTLLSRGPFKADPVTVEAVLKHPNMRAIAGAEPTAVLGENFVSGLSYKDSNTGESKELAVTGIFAEIGVLPNTDFAKDLVALDEVNRVKADPRTQRTSVEGVWGAGDVTDELYHQNNIAAGDGVKALEDIYVWLKTRA
jgi:alkyl hydroperoxide reductase subunit F